MGKYIVFYDVWLVSKSVNGKVYFTVFD